MRALFVDAGKFSMNESKTHESMIRKLIRRIVFFIGNSYERLWDIFALTEAQAIKCISRDQDKESFERGGLRTSNKLKEFIKQDAVVVDLGCGIGRVEKYLASHCKEIHGVDASRMMIYRAKKRLKNYSRVFFYKNNGRDLSIFPDQKFDFAFSLFVMQHLEKEDVYCYLVELRRTLKVGGKIFLNFPDFLDDRRAKTFVEYAKAGPWMKNIAKMRYYTIPEVRKMLEIANFEVESVYSDGYIYALATRMV